MTLSLWNHRPLNLLVALFALVAVLLAGLPAAAQDSSGATFPPEENTVWGEPLALGDGEINTFVTHDEDGNLSLVGIYFDEMALSGLPEAPSDGHYDILDAAGALLMPCCGHEFVLEFSEEMGAAQFKHALVNWNPTGHPPAGVYDAPHFDFHFYITSVEDREAITAAAFDTMCMVPNPADPDNHLHVPVPCDIFEQAVMPLSDDQMPPGYISVGEVIPAMGNHLVNLASPELMGEAPFTHTWIYGAYGGRLTFYEPMITLAFFEELTEDVCAEISMPEVMPEPGFYPTQYCIRYLPGEEGAGAYTVSVEQFVEFGE